MVKIMENPIKMDDLGVPIFWKHPYASPTSHFDSKCDSAQDVTGVGEAHSLPQICSQISSLAKLQKGPHDNTLDPGFQKA